MGYCITTESPLQSGQAKGGYPVGIRSLEGCSKGYEFELIIFLYLGFSLSSSFVLFFSLILFPLLFYSFLLNFNLDWRGASHTFADDTSSKEIGDPFLYRPLPWRGWGCGPLPSGVTHRPCVAVSAHHQQCAWKKGVPIEKGACSKEC